MTDRPGFTSSAPSWDGVSDTPERWLYAGESVLVTEPLSSGWVAVTTHRLLVFTPDGDGPAFASYDRLNVRDVGVERGGDGTYLSYLPRLVVYGLVFVGGWAVFRQAGLATLLDVDAGDSLDVVGMTEIFDTIRTGLQLLEVGLLVVGLLTLAGAGVLGALYVQSRHPRLVVDVAGDGPVGHPLPSSVATETVSLTRIRSALSTKTE